MMLKLEREQMTDRLRALTAEFEGIVAASLDANCDDEHDPEGATIAFERERTAALRGQVEAHLVEVDRALARVAAGTYGLCRSCRRPITTDRLRALPVTEVCIGCASICRSPVAPSVDRGSFSRTPIPTMGQTSVV
jgi:DnaK suppressor protein